MSLHTEMHEKAWNTHKKKFFIYILGNYRAFLKQTSPCERMWSLGFKCPLYISNAHIFISSPSLLSQIPDSKTPLLSSLGCCISPSVCWLLGLP